MKSLIKDSDDYDPDDDCTEQIYIHKKKETKVYTFKEGQKLINKYVDYVPVEPGVQNRMIEIIEPVYAAEQRVIEQIVNEEEAQKIRSKYVDYLPTDLEVKNEVKEYSLSERILFE